MIEIQNKNEIKMIDHEMCGKNGGQTLENGDRVKCHECKHGLLYKKTL